MTGYQSPSERHKIQVTQAKGKVHVSCTCGEKIGVCPVFEHGAEWDRLLEDHGGHVLMALGEELEQHFSLRFGRA